MPEAPASSESLPQERLQRLPWLNRRASAPPGNGSVQNKIVRFGSLEPAHVTLASRSMLPAVAVLTLAGCMFVAGYPWSREFCALALVAFLICALIFSPLDLRNYKGSERKVASRILLVWSCVVALLVFLAASFKLTHVFSRGAMLSWFVATPFALLLADALTVPIAKWFASERGMLQRYIIVGANDVGSHNRILRQFDRGRARLLSINRFSYMGL